MLDKHCDEQFGKEPRTLVRQHRLLLGQRTDKIGTMPSLFCSIPSRQVKVRIETVRFFFGRIDADLLLLIADKSLKHLENKK